MNQPDPVVLSETVAFEAYFLQDIYQLVQQPLVGSYERVWIYPAGSDVPVAFPGRPDQFYADGIQRWTSGFLGTGGPLIFVTAFKVLDMIVEWIVGPPSKGQQWQFKDKTEAFHAVSTLPGILGARPWLTKRFARLYQVLYPLRNTVIHAARFHATPGGVTVAPSLGRGAYGELKAALSAADIEAMAALAAILARTLDGSWTLNPYLEMQLKWRLDQLASFHGEDVMGAKNPQLSLVRILKEHQLFVEFDVCQISMDVNHRWLVPVASGQLVDVRPSGTVFDLEIGIANAEGAVDVYRIPMTKLDRFPKGISKQELLPFLAESAIDIQTLTGGA